MRCSKIRKPETGHLWALVILGLANMALEIKSKFILYKIIQIVVKQKTGENVIVIS